MNLYDILLLAVLAAAVFFALRGIVLARRAGKSCGGNCADCRLECKKPTGKNRHDKEESP